MRIQAEERGVQLEEKGERLQVEEYHKDFKRRNIIHEENGLRPCTSMIDRRVGISWWAFLLHRYSYATSE